MAAAQCPTVLRGRRHPPAVARLRVVRTCRPAAASPTGERTTHDEPRGLLRHAGRVPVARGQPRRGAGLGPVHGRAGRDLGARQGARPRVGLRGPVPRRPAPLGPAPARGAVRGPRHAAGRLPRRLRGAPARHGHARLRTRARDVDPARVARPAGGAQPVPARVHRAGPGAGARALLRQRGRAPAHGRRPHRLFRPRAPAPRLARDRVRVPKRLPRQPGSGATGVHLSQGEHPRARGPSAPRGPGRRRGTGRVQARAALARGPAPPGLGLRALRVHARGHGHGHHAAGARHGRTLRRLPHGPGRHGRQPGRDGRALLPARPRAHPPEPRAHLRRHVEHLGRGPGIQAAEREDVRPGDRHRRAPGAHPLPDGRGMDGGPVRQPQRGGQPAQGPVRDSARFLGRERGQVPARARTPGGPGARQGGAPGVLVLPGRDGGRRRLRELGAGPRRHPAHVARLRHAGREDRRGVRARQVRRGEPPAPVRVRVRGLEPRAVHQLRHHRRQVQAAGAFLRQRVHRQPVHREPVRPRRDLLSLPDHPQPVAAVPVSAQLPAAHGVRRRPPDGGELPGRRPPAACRVRHGVQLRRGAVRESPVLDGGPAPDSGGQAAIAPAAARVPAPPEGHSARTRPPDRRDAHRPGLDRVPIGDRAGHRVPDAPARGDRPPRGGLPAP